MQTPLSFIPTHKNFHKVTERNHLLVVPRIVNKIGDWYQFPMGIAYVSSCAKRAGFNVHTLNLNHVEGAISDILEKIIREKQIGTVSTGGVTGQYGAIKEIFDATKKHKKDALCICGGGIISSSPETAMTALEICDYGVIGEAELTFPVLLGLPGKWGRPMVHSRAGYSAQRQIYRNSGRTRTCSAGRNPLSRLREF